AYMGIQDIPAGFHIGFHDPAVQVHRLLGGMDPLLVLRLVPLLHPAFPDVLPLEHPVPQIPEQPDRIMEAAVGKLTIGEAGSPIAFIPHDPPRAEGIAEIVHSPDDLVLRYPEQFPEILLPWHLPAIQCAIQPLDADGADLPPVILSPLRAAEIRRI